MVYLRELSRRGRADLDNAILLKLQAGSSTREVERELHVSQSHVSRIRREKLSNIPVSRGGRPPALTPLQKRMCVKLMTSGGFEVATEVAQHMHEDCNIAVSVDTVRRVLNDAGLRAQVKEKKPLLTQKHIKHRFEFAQCHKHWTVYDWEHVIFSDETKVNRFCSDGRSWCWIRDGQLRDLRHIQQMVKFGGGSVMMWGCMTSQGPGMFCRIEGRLNQHQYKEILQRDLMDTVMGYDLNPAFMIFQQDNAAVHTAKSVLQWFRLQEFDLLQWPAHSPDLNPIEHLWGLLKRRLNQHDTPPRGMLELWERIEDCWSSITPEYCRRLYESMPDRIQAVLAAKGKWTDY